MQQSVFAGGVCQGLMALTTGIPSRQNTIDGEGCQEGTENSENRMAIDRMGGGSSAYGD